jgi:hypothetical protein
LKLKQTAGKSANSDPNVHTKQIIQAQNALINLVPPSGNDEDSDCKFEEFVGPSEMGMEMVTHRGTWQFFWKHLEGGQINERGVPAVSYELT